MNIKKQLKNSWQHHTLPTEAKYKSAMSFNEKKRIRISLPFYLASLATVVVIALILIPLSVMITARTMQKNNATPDFLAQSVDAKYNPSFGIVSYNKPYFNSNYTSTVKYGVFVIDTVKFCYWINNLSFRLIDKTYESDNELFDVIANAASVSLLYGNDRYDLYFTDCNYLIIACNNLYYTYDLQNANLLFEQFINTL